jgi:hypothetical protein
VRVIKPSVRGASILFTVGVTLAVAPAAALAGGIAGHSAAPKHFTTRESAVSHATAPVAFRPQGATKAQLLRYGFPDYPGAVPPPAEAQAVAAARKFVPAVAGTADPHGFETAGANTSVDAPNWAGKALTQGNYSEAESSWVVPTTTQLKGDTDPNSLIWDGVGDAASSNTELLQAGTRQKVTDLTPPQYNVGYAFWWETNPGRSVQPLKSPSVGPGDRVFVSVSYTRTTVTFFLENEKSGNFTNFPESFTGASGNIAECIVEDPGNGSAPGKYFDLADFGTVTFTGCEGFNTGMGGFEGIGELAHKTFTMVQGPTTYATVSATSGTDLSNFHVTRQNVP